MDQQLAFYTTKALDLSSTSNALILPLGGTKRFILSVNGLTGSGAELRISPSSDGGVSFSTTNWLAAVNIDFPSCLGNPLVDSNDYEVVSAPFTHLRIYPVKAGAGMAVLSPTPMAAGVKSAGTQASLYYTPI